jgi:hypothetical protein
MEPLPLCFGSVQRFTAIISGCFPHTGDYNILYLVLRRENERSMKWKADKFYEEDTARLIVRSERDFMSDLTRYIRAQVYTLRSTACCCICYLLDVCGAYHRV